MTGALVVIGVAVFIGAVIWLWYAIDRKHMRDSIREADAMMERTHPGWTASRGRKP